MTAISLESPTFLFRLNKLKSFNIINSPSMQAKYEERIKLLKRLDIFEDVDMYILLPLASNIKVRRYKQGEYLVRAGELPEGLFIVTEG